VNNFGQYITPERAIAGGDTRTLEQLQKIAKRRARTCSNCDELEWKFADCGMCFSCTTGEADASDDFEITTDGAAR
jgi:hypothetical protein